MEIVGKIFERVMTVEFWTSAGIAALLLLTVIGLVTVFTVIMSFCSPGSKPAEDVSTATATAEVVQESVEPTAASESVVESKSEALLLNEETLGRYVDCVIYHANRFDWIFSGLIAESESNVTDFKEFAPSGIALEIIRSSCAFIRSSERYSELLELQACTSARAKKLWYSDPRFILEGQQEPDKQLIGMVAYETCRP